MTRKSLRTALAEHLGIDLSADQHAGLRIDVHHIPSGKDREPHTVRTIKARDLAKLLDQHAADLAHDEVCQQQQRIDRMQTQGLKDYQRIKELEAQVSAKETPMTATTEPTTLTPNRTGKPGMSLHERLVWASDYHIDRKDGTQDVGILPENVDVIAAIQRAIEDAATRPLREDLEALRASVDEYDLAYAQQKQVIANLTRDYNALKARSDAMRASLQWVVEGHTPLTAEYIETEAAITAYDAAEPHAKDESMTPEEFAEILMHEFGGPIESENMYDLAIRIMRGQRKELSVRGDALVRYNNEGVVLDRTIADLRKSYAFLKARADILCDAATAYLFPAGDPIAPMEEQLKAAINDYNEAIAPSEKQNTVTDEQIRKIGLEVFGRHRAAEPREETHDVGSDMGRGDMDVAGNSHPDHPAHCPVDGGLSPLRADRGPGEAQAVAAPSPDRDAQEEAEREAGIAESWRILEAGYEIGKQARMDRDDQDPALQARPCQIDDLVTRADAATSRLDMHMWRIERVERMVIEEREEAARWNNTVTSAIDRQFSELVARLDASEQRFSEDHEHLRVVRSRLESARDRIKGVGEAADTNTHTLFTAVLELQKKVSALEAEREPGAMPTVVTKEMVEAAAQYLRDVDYTTARNIDYGRLGEAIEAALKAGGAK
jgi:hypothetical protein